MENKIIDKKVINAKEAAEISVTNNYHESLLENLVMPQIKIQAKKGLRIATITFTTDTEKIIILKIDSALQPLGYSTKLEYRTLTIRW